MKNMIKMSLVAAVAVAGLTTTSSANTLKEAFAASTVKGEIKSLYFTKETKAGVKSNIWTNGGNVSVKTGSFNGLTAGVTFQTAHVASDKNAQTNAQYGNDMDASGSVMSEAYIAYTLGNTTAKVGRQYITTPLVAGSGSRMFKESYEAIVLANTDLPNTTLVAAYVSKAFGRTDTNGGVAEFDKNLTLDTGDVNEDGAYTIYAKNTSVQDLTIQAQYAVVGVTTAGSDDIKVAYADASYKLAPVTISAQTYQSDNGAATNSDGALYGIKAAAKVGMVSLMAAYTTTDNDAAVVRGIGNGADLPFTGGAIAGGGSAAAADTDSYKVGAGTTVAGLGLNVSYANWETNGSADDSETNFTASYKVNKEASIKVMHSIFDGTAQDTRSRVYLSYKF